MSGVGRDEPGGAGHDGWRPGWQSVYPPVRQFESYELYLYLHSHLDPGVLRSGTRQGRRWRRRAWLIVAALVVTLAAVAVAVVHVVAA